MTKPATKKTAAGKASGSTAAAAPSKLDTTVTLLRRVEGATLAQLVEAIGWQAHSVRGAMSGTLKKKRGLTIASDKADGVRTYRIVDEAAA